MHLLFSLPFLALSFFVADVAANPHGSPHVARHAHDSLARRAPGDVAVHLHKRFSNTRWTFYDVGLGACGKVNSRGDFIVALNSAQFIHDGGYPSPICFKTITMSYGGKTTTATIMDECPGCPYGGLDLSRGLFDFFASESAGVISGEWSFGDSKPDPTPTTTKTSKTHTPTPTTTKEEPPTTTKTPPPSTTSSKTSSSSTWSSSSKSPERPTSSSSSSSSSSSWSSSSSSINYSSGAASNLAVPTGVTVSDNAPHNLLTMNQAIVGVGGIIVAGQRAA